MTNGEQKLAVAGASRQRNETAGGNFVSILTKSGSGAYGLLGLILDGENLALLRGWCHGTADR